MAALRRLGCLHVADRTLAPGGERALLEVALDHSPRVEEAGPGVVYLDVAGLGGLFGSEDEIARRLRDAAAAGGVEARVGIAGSRIGALITARRGPGAAVIPPGDDASHLASAPVSLLDLTPEMAARLDRWGIRTLGQLAALPGAALAARLGSEGTRLQRLARGEDPRPLLPWTPPLAFEESIEPGWEVDALGPLGEMLTTLAERVCASLERRGLSADQLEWICRLTTGAVHEGHIAPAVPMNDPAAVAMLLRASLDSHPPRKPVVGLTLRARPIRMSAAQESLSERARPTPRLLAATLARLAALVGAPHVGIPFVLDTHAADPMTLSPPGRGQGEGQVQTAPKSVQPSDDA